MSKWTDAELKQEAIHDYQECRECGHYPDWTNEPLTTELIKKWSVEYDMNENEFKRYINYFYECLN